MFWHELYNVCEVIEGECKGKFLLMSILGNPVLVAATGEVKYFDTIEEALAFIDVVADRLAEVVRELRDSHDMP